MAFGLGGGLWSCQENAGVSLCPLLETGPSWTVFEGASEAGERAFHLHLNHFLTNLERKIIFNDLNLELKKSSQLN